MKRAKLLIPVMALSLIFSCQKESEKDGSKDIVVVEKRDAGVSKIPAPQFEDKELTQFAKEYDEFMNSHLTIYDKYAPGSDEVRQMQEDYLNDAQIYRNKLSDMLNNASDKDNARFQDYLLAKQQELQDKTEQVILESAK